MKDTALRQTPPQLRHVIEECLEQFRQVIKVFRLDGRQPLPSRRRDFVPLTSRSIVCTMDAREIAILSASLD
jgi:hypothetical protein